MKRNHQHIEEAHSQLYHDAVDLLNSEIYDGSEKDAKGIVSKFGYYSDKQTNKDGNGFKKKNPNSKYYYGYSDGTDNIPADATDDNFTTYDVDMKVKYPTDKKGKPSQKGSVADDKNIFSLGNAKIGGDTLMFNMTTAINCPAQGLCAVAKACYAKHGEMRLPNTYIRNLRNQNMIKLLHAKGKLDLFFQVLKLFIIDLEQEGHTVNYIRLNENGDFPSPDLVKAFDDFAGEVSHGIKLDIDGFCGNVMHPIKVVAYTAQGSPRFFEAFKNVKHMIINASLPNINVGDDKYIKRRFYAISSDEYDALPDTDIEVAENGNVPVVRMNSGGGAVKGYYYKCPCNITDKFGFKRQCPSCQICYNSQPAIVRDENDENVSTVNSYYVFVAAHGGGKAAINNHASEVNSKRNSFAAESVQSRVDRLMKYCRVLSERIEQRPAIPSREMSDNESIPDEYVVGGGKDDIHIFKLAKLYEDEKGEQFLVPLYINNGKGQSPTEKWQVGKWYEAGIGEHRVEIDDKTGEVIRFLKVKASIGQGLSFRPGLHSGDMPYAPHIYTQKPNYGEDDLDGEVWTGEYEDDGKGGQKKKMVPGREKSKYQQITNASDRRKYRNEFPYHKTRLQPKGTAWAEILVTYSKDDQAQVGKNGISKLPQYGYKWRTNTSASSDAVWYISRYMKVLRILSDQQVKQICASMNIVALDKDGSQIAAMPEANS